MFCLDKYAFFEEELYFYVQHSLIIDFRIRIMPFLIKFSFLIVFGNADKLKKLSLAPNFSLPKAVTAFIFGAVLGHDYIHILSISFYYPKKYCLYSKLHCKMQKMFCNS